MAVTTAYSNLYSNEKPIFSRPIASPDGADVDIVTHTIPTTQLDDAGDFTHLIPVKQGKRLVALAFDCADLDSGTGVLDADLVLRTTDKNGVHTNTILFNAGTAFGGAQTGKWVFLPTLPAVPDDADGSGSIGLLVNVAANVAAAGAITLMAIWR